MLWFYTYSFTIFGKLPLFVFDRKKYGCFDRSKAVTYESKQIKHSKRSVSIFFKENIMTVFWLIIELLATAFENWIVITFYNKASDCKFCESKNRFIKTVVILLMTLEVSILNRFYIFEGWLVIITIAISMMYIFIALRGPVIFKFTMPIIAYSVILVINVIVTYMLSTIFGRSDEFIFLEYDGARLIALFLTKLMFYIAMKLITAIFKKENIKINSKEAMVSTVMSLITFLIAIALVIIEIETRSGNILIFICILGILLLDVFIVYMMKRLAEDKLNKLKISILELQLSEQKHMIDEVGKINTEIRKTEHDLRHHLLCVLNLIGNSDLNSAESYIKNLLHEYETTVFKYITIDNSAINSILNLKIGHCHSQNIDIKCEIESDFDDFIDIDICVLIANLFDNAIEASDDVEFPFISLSVRNEKNYLCIAIRNKINGSVMETNRNFKTTKSDKENHGFGLYSVSQIVEKYDGMKSYYEEKNCFNAVVWLKRKTSIEIIKN